MEDRTTAAQATRVEALYRSHARPLYAFIYSKVGAREAAEDLTSEVFIKALTHLDPARDEHSVVAWLFRVARNAVNDYWRSAGRGGHVIPFEEAILERRGGGSTAAEQARRAHTAAEARALLDRLPESYRSVLSCRLLEGLSVAETAGRLGISESYVKVLQHRALKRAAE